MDTEIIGPREGIDWFDEYTVQWEEGIDILNTGSGIWADLMKSPDEFSTKILDSDDVIRMAVIPHEPRVVHLNGDPYFCSARFHIEGNGRSSSRSVTRMTCVFHRPSDGKITPIAEVRAYFNRNTAYSSQQVTAVGLRVDTQLSVGHRHPRRFLSFTKNPRQRSYHETPIGCKIGIETYVAPPDLMEIIELHLALRDL